MDLIGVAAGTLDHPPALYPTSAFAQKEQPAGRPYQRLGV